MNQKTVNIIGWVLTGMVGALLALSAMMKLMRHDTALAQAAAAGIDADTYFMIGVVEAVALLLFLIPRTAVVGLLLLAAYMGGAIAMHVQLHQPIGMAVLVQVGIWVAGILRLPELRRRLIFGGGD